MFRWLKEIKKLLKFVFRRIRDYLCEYDSFIFFFEFHIFLFSLIYSVHNMRVRMCACLKESLKFYWEIFSLFLSLPHAHTQHKVMFFQAFTKCILYPFYCLSFYPIYKQISFVNNGFNAKMNQTLQTSFDLSGY